ncbi:phosphorothioated DNA-binding restriction endonuclease [Streptomyces sp. NPDC054796]
MDWIGKVRDLRQWSRGGERAPHKPLLMLYALGRHQRDPDAALRYSDVERDLRTLLEEYGPPRGTTPAYPFHHLTSDGVWEVRTDSGGGSPGSGITALRESGAAGRLAPGLRAALAEDAELLPELARLLLTCHFPASLHEDIAADVGLDLETAPWAVRATGLVRDRARAVEMRRRVLEAYENACAFCGFDGALGGRPVGLEAAHVRWWAFSGPDDLSNALCLCALHHKLFDKGALGLDPGLRIVVSQGFAGSGAAARSQVSDLAGRPLHGPRRGAEAVDARFVDWHTRQVFRAGPRRRQGAGAEAGAPV